MGSGLLADFLQDIHMIHEGSNIPAIHAFFHQADQGNGAVERLPLTMGAWCDLGEVNGGDGRRRWPLTAGQLMSGKIVLS